MAIDMLTTREAVRRAALEDLVSRADIAAVTIEPDTDVASLDGLKVISLGKLRNEMTSALMIALDLELDDHRLRILRAVAAVGDRYTDSAETPGAEQAPPPSLDVIARELELATEADRFDLLDSLTGYAQADPPLVVIDETTTLTAYSLTDAGSELIDQADAGDDDVDVADAKGDADPDSPEPTS